MDFTGIGKIGTFAKQKNLLFAANYRIKTGQSIVDGSGRLTLTKSTMFSSIQTSKKKSVSAADKTRLASIKQKLKSGKKLSAAEMDYLKEKDPSTYKKAKYADEAREELKAELQQADTKQEARQAVMRAVAKIAADCSADFEALKGGAGGGGGGVNFGGDISVDMNFGGAENISAENISAETLSTENISSGEVATAENLTNAENLSNENSTAQNNLQVDGEEKSDGAADILDKYIYAIRAVQDEWLNFIKSDEYKNLPEDIFEIQGGKNLVDAILAYKKSMEYGLKL